MKRTILHATRFNALTVVQHIDPSVILYMLMTIDPTHNHEYTSMLPEGEFYVISSPLLSQPDKEKNHSYSPTLRILIHNPECITKSILSGPVSNHNKCLIDLTVQHDDYHKETVTILTLQQ